MPCVEVRNQAELDKALTNPGSSIHCIGGGRFLLWGNASAVLWGNASAVLWGNASAELRGNASAVLWENASAVLRGASHAHAHDTVTVTAGPYTAVHQHSERAQITGGVVIQVPRPITAESWCAFYGVQVSDGVAIVFKAVRGDDYQSAHKVTYAPGTLPEAPDWDGGREECGGGLHFSPHPAMALSFDEAAARFVACPVALADMRPPTLNDQYPEKVKARRVCQPIYEVDRRGRRLERTA